MRTALTPATADRAAMVERVEKVSPSSAAISRPARVAPPCCATFTMLDVAATSRDQSGRGTTLGKVACCAGWKKA
jgi:hypothetical protein